MLSKCYSVTEVQGWGKLMSGRGAQEQDKVDIANNQKITAL